LKKIKVIKKVVVCLLIIISFTHLTACGSKDLDTSAEAFQENSKESQAFEKGASRKQVIKSKNKKYEKKLSNNKRLVYGDEPLPYIEAVVMQDYTCIAEYKFENDKLIEKNYVMSVPKQSTIDFIKDYKQIKQILSKQYGEPYEEQEQWEENVNKKKFSSLKEAILADKLTLGASWIINEDTHLQILVSGNDEKIIMGVQYTTEL
jgi:hypothetical protein